MRTVYKSIITGLILLSILKTSNAQTNCSPYCKFPDFVNTPSVNPLKLISGDTIQAGDPSIIYDESDSLYKMYYTLFSQGVLGTALAFSSDGITWTKYDFNGDTHILKPTPGGWDWQGIETVSVLKKDSLYYMWYYGYPCDRPIQDSGRWQCIGLATSLDGKIWNKVGSDAILKPTENWEQPVKLVEIVNGTPTFSWGGGVLEPSVSWDKNEQKFKMWYEGFTYKDTTEIINGDTVPITHRLVQIGYATSLDGITWAKDSTNPVFSPSFNTNQSWESPNSVGHTNVLPDPVCGYHLFYESLNNIGHAYSEDGITNWIRNPNNPIIQKDTTDTTSFLLVGGPSAFYRYDSLTNNTTYRLYFMQTSPGVTTCCQGMQIGMAEFTPCDTTITSTEFIELKTMNDILVYPNPFQDETNIKFNSSEINSYTLIIYNINGQLVREIRNIASNSIVIKRENMKSGLYFFQITNRQTIIGNGKLLVE